MLSGPSPYERGPYAITNNTNLSWPPSHRRGSRTARPFNGPPASPTSTLLFLPTSSFVRDFGKLGTNMSARFSSSREGEERVRVRERERGAKQDEAPGRAKRLIECRGTGSHTRDARARPWAPRDVRLPFSSHRPKPIADVSTIQAFGAYRDLFVDRTLVD